ncbi:hypothetical protein KSC_023640 [Ktedonobacter sp. SOSP1-52]|uniref:hypothetical protein n=1 Tax=Ktedonobacter sp. SOSP1-52 TaxID=2778366 RepID=UPI001915DB09|nr:hypothetical protein [Ktedonobacter sp. SOSP1-52]GHO63472.1 hypothetical protein KSC_023640 [Ktedonobacter sp. SOSP1-52]
MDKKEESKQEKSRRHWALATRLEQEYNWLFTRVSHILAHRDPMGLTLGNPSRTDYYLEVGTILARVLDEAKSPDTVLSILYEEFRSWFGGVLDSKLEKRPKRTRSLYKQMSEEIWAAYQQWLAENPK